MKNISTKILIEISEEKVNFIDFIDAILGFEENNLGEEKSNEKEKDH